VPATSPHVSVCDFSLQTALVGLFFGAFFPFSFSHSEIPCANFLTAGEVTDEQRRMIEYCLESGSQINSKNKFGETPLIQAAAKLQPDVCSLLLEVI
jgi:ankyrin repeat protein